MSRRWYKKHYYHKKSSWTSKIIILIIFILLIGYFTTAFDSNEQIKEIKDKIKTEIKNIELKGSITNSLGLQIGNSCPQLNYPMQEHNYGGKYLPDKNYDGWFVTSENYLNQMSNPFLKSMQIVAGNINPYKIICSLGNQKGENPNYWYCGETYIRSDSFEDNGYAVIIKPTKNADGTIGETIIKTFVNVYDSNGNFIKTTCGKSPDSLRDDARKEFMREADEFFSY